MEQRLRRLALKFKQQGEFATSYSPLYARLFGTVAGWLGADDAAGDPVAEWLIQAGHGRTSLEVTLLLAAGLHRDVLDRRSAVNKLASYFPTVNGLKPVSDLAFDESLRQAIISRQDSLREFIQRVKVQTNETGRGLCWLLPLAWTGWNAVHLVDLGASAGLNLVADQRAYRLTQHSNNSTLLDLGWGQPVQFVTHARGCLDALKTVRLWRPPQVVSRTGCDMSPFVLDTLEDERTLMAFIWGDQVERLQRLQEGIEALRQIQATDARVTLVPASLPDELPEFFNESIPTDLSDPVVVYNTYLTNYLPDKGGSLGDHIGTWAVDRKQPVLWLQWEVPRDGRKSTEDYWCAWSAELWRGSSHRQWHLGWVHPHGTEADFGTGLVDWIEFWSRETGQGRSLEIDTI